MCIIYIYNTYNVNRVVLKSARVKKKKKKNVELSTLKIKSVESTTLDSILQYPLSIDLPTLYLKKNKLKNVIFLKLDVIEREEDVKKEEKSGHYKGTGVSVLGGGGNRNVLLFLLSVCLRGIF